MAANDPDCEGILVNCATREISFVIVISKETVSALLLSVPPAA